MDISTFRSLFIKLRMHKIYGLLIPSCDLYYLLENINANIFTISFDIELGVFCNIF